MSVQLEVLHAYAQQGGGLEESILQNNNEIKRLATMLTRLTDLLLEGKMAPEEYATIALKYDNKLRSSIELRELYSKRIQEESMINIKELDSVLQDKELLSVRKKIGDMCDQEYRIKVAAVNWDINKINKKTDHLKMCLSLLQSLPHQVEPEISEEIGRLAEDNCKALKNTRLDAEARKKLANSIKTIAQIIA